MGKLQTDGKIRRLRWWDEYHLLLAGCVDEKVIAFDATGRRKWIFTSEMDRAVYEAAKTYWFKSAPGHEGIHGLRTGSFDEGLVVALTGKCQKVWSTRLPTPPVSLRCMDPPGARLPRVVVGCDDGTVTALDEQGAIVRVGNVSGRPKHMEAFKTRAGSLAVLATDRGAVKGFKIAD